MYRFHSVDLAPLSTLLATPDAPAYAPVCSYAVAGLRSGAGVVRQASHDLLVTMCSSYDVSIEGLALPLQVQRADKGRGGVTRDAVQAALVVMQVPWRCCPSATPRSAAHVGAS